MTTYTRHEACGLAGIKYSQLQHAYQAGHLARPEWSGGRLYNDADIEKIKEYFSRPDATKRGPKKKGLF